MKEANFVRECNIAERSHSTASDLEHITTCIDFPDDLTGITIVDLCAGSSSSVLELQRLGARTIGIDYFYSDLDGFIESLRRFFDDDTDVARQNTAMLKSEDNILLKEKEAETAAFFSAHRAEMNLVTALCGTLPLADNSADFCYSIDGIAPFLLEDEELLIGAISEVIRILKPGKGLEMGGQLQIYAWGGPADYSVDELKSMKAVQRYLEQLNVPYFIEPTIIPEIPRLRIIKS